MISFIVRMSFRNEDRVEVQNCLVELARYTRQEPGCVSYVPHWMEGANDTILLYEQYRDEAAVEYHRASEHFKKFAIGGLYQKMLERHLENLQAIA